MRDFNLKRLSKKVIVPYHKVHLVFNGGSLDALTLYQRKKLYEEAEKSLVELKEFLKV